MERKQTGKGEGNEAKRVAPKRKIEEQITEGTGRCRPKVPNHARTDSVHQDQPAMNPGSQKPEEAVPKANNSPPPPSATGSDGFYSRIVDNSRPTSDLDGDGENPNLGANVPPSDLEYIAPNSANSASRRCPETRDDVQIPDTVGGSGSCQFYPEDESSTEPGTESDKSEELNRGGANQSSPPRPRQAAEMTPGLQIRQDDPYDKSAFSFVNRSRPQEAGPAGGSRELAASTDGVAHPRNSSSSHNGVAHPPVKKSESPPIKIFKEELINLPPYTSSSSSTSGDENPDDGDNGPTLVEESIQDMSLLAGANWRKSVKAVPGIAPAQGTSSDSD